MADIERDDEMLDEDVPTITLEFDDESVECEPLFVFEFEGTDYIALWPVDESSDDVYLYEYHELNDTEFEFIDIEDDDLFDRVSEEFERIMEEVEV